MAAMERDAALIPNRRLMLSMRQTVVVIGVTLLCASCASSSGARETGSQVDTRVNSAMIGSTRSDRVTAQPTSYGAAIEAPASAVFDGATQAYKDLGIELTFRQPSNLSLGTTFLRVKNRLGDLRGSRIFDCGSDLRGDRADTYEIKASMETRVTPGATNGTATLTTTVLAVARNNTTSNIEVTCSSRGELERRIEAAARSHAVAAATR
jgi:hypothetical protein